nr:MAG TPA: hypothetical protein [Inoviridae sp.]
MRSSFFSSISDILYTKKVYVHISINVFETSRY